MGRASEPFDSGDVYEGRFRNGRPDGRGVLRKADDSYIYDGDWCDGMMHGDGEIIWEKHKEYIRYLGEFKENIRQGRGMLETKDGTIYKGHFINGSMIKGRIILQDESVYEGEVKGGVPHGTGTMHWSNGTTFHGEWLHGHLTALANNRTLPSQPYVAALVKLGLVVQGRERLW